jgi:hypothetical protein
VRIAAASTNQSVTLETGNTISSYERLFVPEGGLLVDLFASNNLSCVTGLEYQERGVGQSVPYYNSFYLRADSLNYKFKYLSLPLLGRFRCSVSNFKPYVLGGCSINYNLEPGNGESLVLDAMFGLGTRVEDVFPLPVFCEGRYAIDLTPAFKRGFNEGIENVKSHSISVALGISF